LKLNRFIRMHGCAWIDRACMDYVCVVHHL
jgi:hypothetical protein